MRRLAERIGPMDHSFLGVGRRAGRLVLQSLPGVLERLSLMGFLVVQSKVVIWLRGMSAPLLAHPSVPCRGCLCRRLDTRPRSASAVLWRPGQDALINPPARRVQALQVSGFIAMHPSIVL
jgi:hypothetical protein